MKFENIFSEMEHVGRIGNIKVTFYFGEISERLQLFFYDCNALFQFFKIVNIKIYLKRIVAERENIFIDIIARSNRYVDLLKCG